MHWSVNHVNTELPAIAKKKSWVTCGKKFATWRPPQVFYIQNGASASWSNISTVSGCLRRFDMASLLFECCCRSQFCRSEGSKIAVQPCFSEIMGAKNKLTFSQDTQCLSVWVLACSNMCNQICNMWILCNPSSHPKGRSYTQVKSSERETVPSWCLVSARPAIHLDLWKLTLVTVTLKATSKLTHQAVSHSHTSHILPVFFYHINHALISVNYQWLSGLSGISNDHDPSIQKRIEHHLLTALPDVAHGVRQQLLGSRDRLKHRAIGTKDGSSCVDIARFVRKMLQV